MDATTGNAPTRAPAVFILDCDNTLLDNDAVKSDMDAQLKALLGDDRTARFWETYEHVREAEGVVDLPQTFNAFRLILQDDDLLHRVSGAIMDYPFQTRLFPQSLGAIAHLETMGMAVIVSDGDSVYQPRKIELSGLAAAVHGQWVVYTHKEDHLAEVMAHWPAEFYVMVDDKARILAETKRRLPDRFVTVHILQGHYAGDTYTPAPDLTLPNIGDLESLDLATLRGYLKPA
ncbi:MAG TPA: HAD family hydrolase [Ktedonobacterales bacterium]